MISKMRLSVRQVSILLTIIALLLWSYSITQAKLDISKYGLLQGFPITFFVALGILTIASIILWNSRESHGKLLLLQFCFLAVSLLLAHLIVEGAQPNYSDLFSHLGTTEHIIREGFTSPNQFWLLNWPGSYILQSVALIVSGKTIEDFASFIPWLPIIWQFMWFFPLFVFFKNTIGKAHPNYYWAAMWVFCIGNWVGQQNNTAAPLGMFFILSILAILSNSTIWKQNTASFGYKFAAILILAAATVTHLLS
jgi:hypothetical protein